MKQSIAFPRLEGTVSRQAHADLPEGTYEREAGREGFFGPATHFHHTHPPTGWVEWEGPLKPRAFDLNRLGGAGVSPWDAAAVFHNAHVKFRLWRADESMLELARNGDGDELIFVHEGAGELFCDYGHLSFGDGDYIVIPRSTNWRIEVREPVVALLVEATEDAYALPDRGIVGRHAIFDPAVLETPKLDEAFRAQQGETTTRVTIKRRGQISRVTYPFNPLDAVGWHGDLAPVRLNWRDIRPLMSHRYHLPPSAHTTFLAKRFVVCTFAPRPIESDPGALKVPFYHNNDDYDEVIFYHRGQFFSRDNIKPGMLTLHPCGFTHGPHPKAFQVGQQFARKETDEVAVMVDTRDPVEMADLPEGVELGEYVRSWMPKP
jgi:homogentisate 1,2-dioxygenase